MQQHKNNNITEDQYFVYLGIFFRKNIGLLYYKRPDYYISYQHHSPNFSNNVFVNMKFQHNDQ